jgi:transposase-like protein
VSEKPLPRTLLEATRYFADPEVCVQFVAKFRWPDGPICPACGGTEHSYLTTRRLWKCRACKKQFSVKVGTIFEDSPIPLDKWLCAIWLIANSKNGISSHELGRAVGLTQKSAWFVNHRIRLAMQTGTFANVRGRLGREPPRRLRPRRRAILLALLSLAQLIDLSFRNSKESSREILKLRDR